MNLVKMFAVASKKHLLTLSVLTLCMILVCAGNAQDSQAGSETVKKPETVAVLPWIYLKGTNGAKKTAREFLDTVLTKSDFEVIPEARVAVAWKDMNLSLGEDRKELPTPKELLSLGEKLGVDWVITGKAEWHTRSIWVGLGPKTKSDCTVDVIVVDVRKREIALDARKVKMDSTAKEDTLKAVGTVLLTPLFTIVSGGPKTPHEQRAVQLAIAKAIQPWLAERPQSRKIAPDKRKID